jgi:TP901 family phage tail tape measure protein
MAEFTPYGDPFDRINKLLGSLDADAAALEAESRNLGSTVDEVEKARARLAKQAESQIGRTPPDAYSTASTRRTPGQPPIIPPDRRLPPGQPPPRQLPPGPPPGSRIGLPEGTYPKRSLLERNPLHPDEIAASQRAIRESKDASEAYAKSAGRAASAERDWSAATRDSLSAQGTATRNLRAYGALTTEFFASAQRGTVTLRELGYQTTATIQKFGGWIGAGAAVYAALGAVSLIGKGAIDSSSGVSELDRVVDNIDPSETTKRFRELSKEFNLPISDVADASYQMGKVFHDQNAALDSSRSILYAVKVGELDVATASRYLTSIVNGFNLTAEQQAQVFDQVNEAQNRYSISISNVLAGTAKAAGSFRAAGGDVTHLIALITALSKASGQTGDVIGTAIQRSPHFIALQKNQDALRSFGLDPEQGITELYASAIKAAKGQSGDKQRQIAEALFGPQYGARVGIFLLQQGKLFKKVLADVQPEKAKGSAQRELNSVLDQTDERLKAIVTSLEILGANLESAGAFDVLKVALGSLQAMLDVTNNLLEVFNALPKPLRQVITLAAQAGLALKAARFVNVGQSLGGQGTALGSFFTAPNQQAKLYRDTLARQDEELAVRREAASNGAVRASLRAQALDAQLVAAKGAEAEALRKYGSGSAEVLAATDTTAATAARVNAAERAFLDASLERDIILKEQQLIAEQQALMTRRTTNAQARAVANAYGVRIPGAAGSPNLDEAEKIRAEAAAKAAAGGTVILPSGTAIPSSAVTGADADALKKASLEKRSLADNLRRVSAEGGRLGLAGGALVLAGRSASTKLSKARSSIGKINLASIGRGMTGLATSLGAMLGPLDALILAAIFLPELADQFFSRAEEMSNNLSNLQGHQAKSPEDLENQINSLIREAEGNYNTIEKLSGVGDQLAEAATETAEVLDKYRTGAELALIKGEFVSAPGALFQGDIEGAVKDYIDRFERGDFTRKQFNKAMANLYKTIASSFGGKEEQKIEAAARTAVINAQNVDSRYQDFASLAGKDLEKQINAYSEVVSSGFGTDRDIDALIERSLPQIAEGLKARDPGKRAFAAKGLDALVKGLQGAAQRELDTALLFAKGQKERNKAYDDYLKSIDPKQVTGIFDNQRQQLSRQLSTTNRNIANLKQNGQDAGPEEERAKRIRKSINALGDAQREVVKQLNKVAKEEVRDQRFEENTQLFEARTDLRVAELPEGLESARYQLKRIRIQVARAIKHYGRESQQVLELLTREQGILADIAQQQIDLIQAQGEYQVSLIDADVDPIGASRARLVAAERVLAATKSNPRASRVDILQAMADVNEARQDLANEIRSQAEEVKEASFELARARAGEDEVRIAGINVREAKYKLKQARTPADRIQAEAELINARREKQKAAAQSQIEDIEFQADIGKLSTEQQIRAYEGLLKTLDLTKNMKRDLRRKIYDLKHDAEGDDFDLNVGDIKLPSIYEIKRAIAGGVQGGPQRTEVNTTNQITVNANGADANEVVNKLSKTLDGTTTSSLRSAGLI